MKILLAPAKTIKITKIPQLKMTVPKYKDFAHKFWSEISTYNCKHLQKYFKINDVLAQKLSHSIQKQISGHAIFSFNGLVYKQLDTNNMLKNHEYIHNHILILDALHGILQPFDEINYYRYDYNVTNKEHLKEIQTFYAREYNKYFNANNVYLNLASNEYTKPLAKLNIKMIKVKFLNYNKKGKLVVNATKSKIARGKLTNYLIKNNITEIELVKCWNEGYYFDNLNSDHHNLIFCEN